MQNRGRVTAFDISGKRAKLMRQMTTKAGALKLGKDKGGGGGGTGKGDGCVEIKNEDFLMTNPKDTSWRDVEAIVVDPSCSGSGNSSAD